MSAPMSIQSCNHQKKPVKDSNETSVKSHEHFMAQSTINIIERLVTTNSNIQQLLSEERKVNNDLKNKITKLQLEVEKLKYENCRLLDSSLVFDGQKTDKVQERTSIATVDSNPGEKIAQQWKEIQKQKHREFTQLKAQKEQAQETSDVRRKTTKQQRIGKVNNNNNYNTAKGGHHLIPKRKHKSNNKTMENITRSQSNNFNNGKTSNSNTNYSKKTQMPPKRNINKQNDSCSNTRKVNGTLESNTPRRILLLGDSHVRRVGETNSLSNCILARGIGGLKSDQLVSKHRGTINSELEKTDEVIIHVGSNDISKGVKQDAVTNDIDRACGKLREINPNIEIAVSSNFLQKYDTTKNLQIIETNAALER